MYDNIRTKLVTLLYGKQSVLYLSRKTNADCMNIISGFLEKGVSLPIRVLNSITHSYKDISKEPKIFRIKLEKILNFQQSLFLFQALQKIKSQFQ